MADLNLTWNGRPTRVWMRQRRWGRQFVVRARKPPRPTWLHRHHLAHAEWVRGARLVREHMRELDTVLVPAFTALLDRLDSVHSKEPAK